MKRAERTTRVWHNPIYNKDEVVLTTKHPWGEHMGAVAKIVGDGEVEWYPDIDSRLDRDGITRGDIVDDLNASIADRSPRLHE